jgi:hypothetical protein
MKKLLVIALVLATLPLFGQGTSVNLGLVLDPNYFMMTPKDDAAASESFFGEVSAALIVNAVLPGDVTGYLKYNVNESMSNASVDTTLDLYDQFEEYDLGGLPAVNGGEFVVDLPSFTAPVGVEELWVAKKGVFNQDDLGFKFGKHDVVFNLNIDKGITHAMTDGDAAITSGIGAQDNKWGFAASYAVANVGTFSLTTFEAIGGTDNSGTDPVDEDSGLFTSMALNWDTGVGVDAFGVAGLRIVVGYAMLASEEDLDNGSIISLGGTYTIPGMPLVVSLEIDMSTAVTAVDQQGGMLMAIGADYDVNAQFKAGLKYESLAYSKDDDISMDANSDSRLALYGSYILAENSEIRFEYSDLTNSEYDTVGYSLIAIGYKGTL